MERGEGGKRGRGGYWGMERGRGRESRGVRRDKEENREEERSGR